METSHHEVVNQHEIDMRYDEALRVADRWEFKTALKFSPPPRPPRDLYAQACVWDCR